MHLTQATVYAFISEIDRWQDGRTSRRSVHGGEVHVVGTEEPIFVGRTAELARLSDLCRRARKGQRQVTFVTGEIGIGKTSLVRSFLNHLETDAWIVRGQCVEQFGAGEAYMPLIEGLGRLVRDAGNRPAVNALARYAPSWLTHIPEFPHRRTAPNDAGTRADGMVRELIDALHALTQDKPVILLLEDLQWSDWSTVELIDRIARRDEPARILVIGTYRHDELIRRAHPLIRIQHELRVHRRCDQIHVPNLSEGDVAQYLAKRGSWANLQNATQQLHQWTDGNPLFLSVLFDHLVDTGGVTLADGRLDFTPHRRTLASSIPPTLRDIIDDRFHQLSEAEQQVLTAASVVGSVFSPTLVAAAVRLAANTVEEVLQSLAYRHQFVERKEEEEPFGTAMEPKYGFLHSFYEHVLYDRLTTNLRTDLHRAVGSFLESAYASDYDGIAPELAMHFERSRDYGRAAAYYDAAAAIALARGADHEAHTCALKALEQLAHLPADPERHRQELNVRLKVCAAVANMSSMGDPQVELAYSETLALCDRVGDDAQVVSALLGIARFHDVRGDVETGRRIEKRAVEVARVTGDPLLCVQALQSLAVSSMAVGRIRESYGCAIEAASTARTLPADAARLTSGFDAAAAAMIGYSWGSWFIGYPDQALRSARDAVDIADTVSHPLTIAFTKAYAAVPYQLCGIPDQSYHWAAASLAMARKCEHPFAIAFAEGVLGWVVGRGGSDEGVVALRRALQVQAAMGINLWVPMMSAWLAENLLRAGHVVTAAAAIDDGLQTARQAGVTFYDAELYGLRAEIRDTGQREGIYEKIGGDECAECEALAKQSYGIAEAQEARSLQLRAAARLMRLSTTTIARNAARQLLSDTYDLFSEGFDTQDLSDARTLLDGARPDPPSRVTAEPN